MTEVNNDFGYAGFEVLDRVGVENFPVAGLNGRIGDDYGIHQDIVLGENR